MSKTKIELNSSGIRQLLLSSDVADCVQKEANKVAGRAGNGYEAKVKNAVGRNIAAVYPATDEARRDLYKNNTLEKAVRSR